MADPLNSRAVAILALRIGESVICPARIYENDLTLARRAT
jgi:hypothetical protein